jgi:hypothetical protein
MMITKLDAIPKQDNDAARVRKLIYTDPNITAADIENEIRVKSAPGKRFQDCVEVQYFGPQRDMDPEAPDQECAIVWTKEIRAA